MKDTLALGLETQRRYTVDKARTIDFLSDDQGFTARVYATPALIRDIEETCRDLALEHLDPGEDTLGTHVDIKHLAPTLLGMWVDIEARITGLSGRALNLSVTVRDQLDQTVAEGLHGRFVIDVGKTLERLRGMADAVG